MASPVSFRLGNSPVEEGRSGSVPSGAKTSEHPGGAPIVLEKMPGMRDGPPGQNSSSPQVTLPRLLLPPASESLAMSEFIRHLYCESVEQQNAIKYLQGQLGRLQNDLITVRNNQESDRKSYKVSLAREALEIETMLRKTESVVRQQLGGQTHSQSQEVSGDMETMKRRMAALEERVRILDLTIGTQRDQIAAQQREIESLRKANAIGSWSPFAPSPFSVPPNHANN